MFNFSSHLYPSSLSLFPMILQGSVLTSQFSCPMSLQFLFKLLIFLKLLISFSLILLSPGRAISIMVHFLSCSVFYNHKVWSSSFNDLVTLDVRIPQQFNFIVSLELSDTCSYHFSFFFLSFFFPDDISHITSNGLLLQYCHVSVLGGILPSCQYYGIHIVGSESFFLACMSKCLCLDIQVCFS